MSTPPIMTGKLGTVRKIMKEKMTTQSGYAISMIEAGAAPTNLIAEKIKKLARVARMMDMKMSPRFDLPEVTRALIDPPSKKMNGNMMRAVTTELIKSNVIGDVSIKIFWSSV